MYLTDEGIITGRDKYLKKGYILPGYDRNAVKKKTKEDPEWIHFGAGNIFRAFMGNLSERLLSDKVIDTGLVVCEGFDYELVEKMYRPHDNLSILVTLKADKTVEKKVIGSIVASYVLDSGRREETESLKKIFEKKSLKMCSFTITEKGYVVSDHDGSLTEAVKADIENGPDGCVSYMGKTVALLYHRYLSGRLPIAFVSMDNCSHNGDRLKEAVLTFARGWCQNKKTDDGFLDYVSDPDKVSFPWTMIDKITPRPDETVHSILKEDGIEDLDQIITSANTYAAPFVNAEETEYLVMEDRFPAGRIPLEKAGGIFTDRETVDRVEKMKVCTCLNPLHTALAIFGCLLGFKTIHDEMEDEDLKELVYLLGYKEGMPVVSDPGVLSPEDFLCAVLTKRLPNPFMPDTPQRIATDTSQKIPIRFGETIKAYRASETLDTDDLVLIPLILAAYLRYLKGTDDNGQPFEMSSDPLLDEIKELEPKAVLEKEEIFANDLFADGLGKKILGMYDELCAGSGAVRAVLHRYVDEESAKWGKQIWK